MKKFSTFLSLMAMFLLLPFGARAQEELTVFEGTATSYYVPAYVFYWDDFSKSQFVIPSSYLEDMVGATITSVKFYTTSENIPYTSTSVADMFIKEVDYTSISAYEAKEGVVYSGIFSFVSEGAGGSVTIEFTTPYVYQGGNLLIGIENTTDNAYKQIYFYGQTVNGASIAASNSSSLSGVTSATQRNFIPKTTFTYEPASSGPVCRKPNRLAVSDITTEGATLSWSPRNGETSWRLYADGVEIADSPITGDTSYIFTGLTPSSAHTLGVAAICDEATSFESDPATINFRTACGVLPLPWGENFDNVSSLTASECWLRFKALYNDDAFSIDSAQSTPDGWELSTTNMPTKSLTLNIYGSSCKYWIATPEVAVEANGRLSFDLSLTDYDNSNPPDGTDMADDRFIVFVFNCTDSTLTPLAKWGSQDGMRDDFSYIGISHIPSNVSFSLNDYAGETVRIVFYGESTISGNSSAGADNDLNIDDIVVDVDNGCNRPSTASVSGVTYEGATVSWAAEGEAISGYTVRVTKSNDVNAATAVDYEATSSPHVLSGLSGNTTYYVWVRSNCGEDVTMWRSAGSFTTEQDCYPVQDLRLVDKNMSTAAVSWTIQSRGRECEGVNLKLIDITNTPADTVQEVVAQGTYHFFTGLEGGHSYRVVASAQCDTFASTTQNITFMTDACGRIEGSTTTSTMPFATNYKYGYSQVIYPAEKLQGLGEISQLQFRESSAPSSVYNRIVKVYMAHTDMTLLDTTDYIDINDLTLVYDGVLNVQTTGWKTITLNEPFVYDGSSNIVVAMQNNTGEYNSFSWGAHAVTDSLGNGVYWYRDGEAIDPADPNARLSTGTHALPSRGKSFTVPDITFVGECEAPACAAPLTVVESATESSVTLTWVAGSQESSWVVEYRQYGDTAWTEYNTTSTPGMTVSDLAASTLYEFRVGSQCEEVLYSMVVRGRTSCAAITLPYTESFEGWMGTNPFHSCWYKIQAAGNYPYIMNGASYHMGGTAAMYSSASSGQVSLIATPEVPAEATNIKVTFWAYNWSGATQAGVVSDVTNPSSFEACRVTATGLTEGSMREYEFYTDSVTATGSVHVAFRIATSSSVYIDDVTVAEASNCRRPNTPSVSNVGFYTATLHWNDVNGGNASYQVCYNTENRLAGATLYGETTTGDSIEVSGLQNGQRYYMWVRPECSTNEADWLPMPVFTTQVSCYPVLRAHRVGMTNTTAVVEWEYDYESEGMVPQGAVLSLMDLEDSSWVVENVPESGTSHIFTGLTAGGQYMAYIATVCDPDTAAAVKLSIGGSGDACADVVGTSEANSNNSQVPFNRFYNYSYTQTLYTAEELAGISSISGIGYEAAVTGNKDYTLDVYIGTTTLNTLSTTANNNIAYNALTQVASNAVVNPSEGPIDIMFNQTFAYTGSSNIIVVVVNKTGSYETSGRYFKSHPASGKVVYLNRDGTTPYDPANITGVMTSGSYRPNTKFYGDCGADEDNPCMAPVLVVGSKDNSSVTLNWGIDAANADVTVQRKGLSDTVWTDEAVVSTTTHTVDGLQGSTGYMFRLSYVCNDSTIYSNEVLAYTDCEAMPVPQTFTFGEQLSPCWTLTNTNVSCSTSISALYFSSSSNIGMAVLPEFELPVTSLKVTVHARTSSSNADIAVGVGSVTGAGYTMVSSSPISSSNTYGYYTFYLDSYTGTDNHIIVTKNNGSTSVYVDSIIVEEAESCRPVQGLTLTAVSDNNAVIGWATNPTSNNFDVEYREATANTWQSTTATGTSVNLTGLSSTTQYVVRVRAHCSDADQSEWCAPLSFATTVAGAALPYTTGFESGDDADWTFANNTNGWYIGTATSKDGSQSMYISNDNGASNAYTLGSSSASYAYKPFSFPAGQTPISFDWKADGEGTSTLYDYLRVFIVPASVTLEAGQTNGISASSTPNGWIAVDNGSALIHQTEWQHVDYTATIANAGVYYLVFYWRNDGSAGNQPPAAIDNVQVGGGAGPQPGCEVPIISSLTATENSATMQWSATAQSYEVAIVEGAWTAPATGTAVNSTMYTFQNLTPGTAYTAGVRGVCNGQRTEWATQTVTTPMPGDPECNAPTNVEASNITDNGATISWTAGGNETNWVVEVSGAGNTTEHEVSGTPSKTLTGLEKATAYTVRVKAVCTATSQSPWSQPSMFQTTNVGIEDVTGESFVLYPNPASVSVTVELAEAGMVSILDAAGRESGKWSVENGHLTIDLSGYSAGAYYVRVVTAQGTAVRKLIVR